MTERIMNRKTIMPSAEQINWDFMIVNNSLRRSANQRARKKQEMLAIENRVKALLDGRKMSPDPKSYDQSLRESFASSCERLWSHMTWCNHCHFIAGQPVDDSTLCLKGRNEFRHNEAIYRTINGIR